MMPGTPRATLFPYTTLFRSIGGVLRLLDDEVLWRVHEHQKAIGKSAHKPPAALRPPAISAIWHNSFHDQDRKSTRLNSSHSQISYAVFCLNKKIVGDRRVGA